MTDTRALILVAAVCLLVQLLSATFQRRAFETPNTATAIAETLVSERKYALGWSRAYHLPGEPLYLATGFNVLPKTLWRYLHVPVVVLFVTSVAAVALVVGGPPLAVATGLVASLDPYVVIHGPVWDDTFLAASLEWLIFAVLLTALARRVKTPEGGAIRRFELIAMGCGAALAAVTRSQSQLVLLLVALAAILRTPLRPVRPAGWAIAVGIVLAVGAWGGRNAAVLGSFEMGSTHDGKTLFESNCAYTRQGIRIHGVVGGFLEQCSESQIKHAASLGELDSDRQLMRYALAYIVSHPVDVAKTAAFKIAVSLTGFDFRSGTLSARNVGAVGGSVLMLTLGVYGLWQQWRRMPPAPPAQALLTICAATTAVTLVMLLMGPTGLRYRIGLAGFLYLGVAALAAPALPWAQAREPLPNRTELRAIGN